MASWLQAFEPDQTSQARYTNIKRRQVFVTTQLAKPSKLRLDSSVTRRRCFSLQCQELDVLSNSD